MIQNCYHEFHVRLHQDLDKTGGFFCLTNKHNVIVALCKIKGIILRWKKNS